MSRVEIATQGWGWIVPDNIGLSGMTVTIKKTDGTDATHWTAITGGSSSTANLVTTAGGVIPAFIDSGTYDITVGGVTQRVEAVSAADIAGVGGGGGGASAGLVYDRVLIRGVQTTVNNVLPPGLPFPTQTTLTRIDLLVGTAPTGSALTVVVRQGALVLATTSIAAGATSGSVVLGDPAQIAAGTPVVFDVTTIGSTIPGSDLLITLGSDASVTPSTNVIPFNTPGATTWDTAVWGSPFGANNPTGATYSVPSAGVGRIAGATGGTLNTSRALTEAYLPLATTNVDFTGAVNLNNRSATDGDINLMIRVTARSTSLTRQGLRLQWNSTSSFFEYLAFESGAALSTTAQVPMGGGASPGWIRFRVRGVGNQLQTRLWADGTTEPGTWNTTNTTTLTANNGTAGIQYDFGNNHSADFKELRVQVI